MFPLIYNKYSPEPSKYGMFGWYRVKYELQYGEGLIKESKINF